MIISKEEWKHLNETSSKEEIKLKISNWMAENPFPFPKITEEEALEDFKKLKEFPSYSIYRNGLWATKWNYNVNPANIYLDSSLVGNKSSNFFHQENRYKCGSVNSPSPFRTWNEERFRLTLLNALWSLKVEEITPKILHTAISLRKYIASQFRPSVAKFIYEHFKAESVLDFSAGWGDRLAGFYAADCTKKYYGIDPNKNLFTGYKNQMQAYMKLTDNKHAEIYNLPAEECCSLDNFPKVDLVFTSPPYFNIERYTEEDNQSFKRYRKIDTWLDKFLFNVMERSVDRVKTGGHVVINLSDVYSGHKRNEIINPLLKFMEKKATFINMIGYRMAKRMNKRNEVGVYGEPILIWRKD